jgi:5-methylcytosine-specific restriction endonuclease McrA
VTPSPFLDGNKVEEMAAAMGEPATRSAQQQLKENCLERDNFQCMLTGVTDVSATKHGRSIVGYSGYTILSHIIPFSLGCWDNNEEAC